MGLNKRKLLSHGNFVIAQERGSYVPRFWTGTLWQQFKILKHGDHNKLDHSTFLEKGLDKCKLISKNLTTCRWKRWFSLFLPSHDFVVFTCSSNEKIC